RPLAKLLQYATDPLIPGVSGREDSSVGFLQELQIELKERDTWRTWVDLRKEEKRKIISSIVQMLLSKGFGYQVASRVLGVSYLLCKEEEGTELHDAKEYATLLNSTARYGQYEVGLQVCLGDRGKWLKEALNLLSGHRHNLVEGLQFAREEKIQKRSYVQYFHAGDGIRDTIIGIVTNMLLNTEDVDKELPLIGFAHTETGEVKVSARATQALVDRGLDLAVALTRAAKELNGVGGGHNIAAGATIPKGKEEEFLRVVEREIKLQLVS
ncbi:MAG TPA: DHH family phosphoesterase, partial [Candidatus Thermoplasmatota archaeon]|nr:DHH family phosphoesterase [Candidatus Thermoplasmatota archaeon]